MDKKSPKYGGFLFYGQKEDPWTRHALSVKKIHYKKVRICVSPVPLKKPQRRESGSTWGCVLDARCPEPWGLTCSLCVPALDTLGINLCSFPAHAGYSSVHFNYALQHILRK
jgi:hypothetical protein